MGYTHYWSADQDISQADWDMAIADIKDIVQRHKAMLAREWDEPGTEPEVTSDWIRFNGTGNHGCETFVARRAKHSDYCKTNRAPYDQAVCECLLILRARIPGFKLRSDGFSGWLSNPVLDERWPAAIKAVEKYGLHYEPYISNEIAPYCDFGMRLTENGVEGVRVFDDVGNETMKGA